MKARHKDTGEIIELAEEGIISHDGRKFCWYQVELIPEPIDECIPSLPSNLDEAAYNRVTENGRFKVSDFEKMRIDDIAFGAEWMASWKKQEQQEVDLEKLGEIARHLIAVKDHEEDMRLTDDEWLLLERIGYPERFNIRKEE